MKPVTANRLKLIALIALFAGPIGLAHWLTAIGWNPKQSKAYGELLSPPIEFNASDVMAGEANSTLQWQLLISIDRDCQSQCQQQIEGVLKAHDMLGRHRPALRLARVNANGGSVLPVVQISERLAQAFKPTNPDTISALLLDPRHFLVMRYQPGFDAAGLRRDLGRLVHHNPNSKSK